jgi:hypothetical protein
MSEDKRQGEPRRWDGEHVLLSDDQVDIIAQRICALHPCRFPQPEAEALHMLAQSLNNDGREKWAAIMSFGETLLQLRKASTIALAGLIVSGMVAFVVFGIRHWVQLKLKGV